MIIWVVLLLLPVVTTMSLLRLSREIGATELLWLLLIWLVPVVGAVLWFSAGRPATLAKRR